MDKFGGETVPTSAKTPIEQVMTDPTGSVTAILAGKLDEVRRYCETDVLNTYLIYQRFRLLRGEIDAGEYE